MSRQDAAYDAQNVGPEQPMSASWRHDTNPMTRDLSYDVAFKGVETTGRQTTFATKHNGGDGILMCDNSVDDVIAVLLVRMDHFDISILNDLDDIGDLLEHQYIVHDDNI